MILSDAREETRAADATNCPLNAPAKAPARNRAGLFVVPVLLHLVSTEEALEENGITEKVTAQAVAFSSGNFQGVW